MELEFPVQINNTDPEFLDFNQNSQLKTSKPRFTNKPQCKFSQFLLLLLT